MAITERVVGGEDPAAKTVFGLLLQERGREDPNGGAPAFESTTAASASQMVPEILRVR